MSNILRGFGRQLFEDNKGLALLTYINKITMGTLYGLHLTKLPRIALSSNLQTKRLFLIFKTLCVLLILQRPIRNPLDKQLTY